jgi:hypothetical protein
MSVYKIQVQIPNVVEMDTAVISSPSKVLDISKYLNENIPNCKLNYFIRRTSERDTWNQISLSDLESAVEGKPIRIGTRRWEDG